MSLMDILQRYGNATTGRNQDTADVDFDQVVGEASPDAKGSGTPSGRTTHRRSRTW